MLHNYTMGNEYYCTKYTIMKFGEAVILLYRQHFIHYYGNKFAAVCVFFQLQTALRQSVLKFPLKSK